MDRGLQTGKASIDGFEGIVKRDVVVRTRSVALYLMPRDGRLPMQSILFVCLAGESMRQCLFPVMAGHGTEGCNHKRERDERQLEKRRQE